MEALVTVKAYASFWYVFNAMHFIMTWLADSQPVIYTISKFRMLGPRFNMMSNQLATCNATFLASVLISGKHCFSPLGIFVSLSWVLIDTCSVIAFIVRMFFAGLERHRISPFRIISSSLNTFQKIFALNKVLHLNRAVLFGYCAFMIRGVSAFGRTKFLITARRITKFFFAVQALSCVRGVMAFPRTIFSTCFYLAFGSTKNLVASLTFAFVFFGSVYGKLLSATLFRTIFSIPVLKTTGFSDKFFATYNASCFCQFTWTIFHCFALGAWLTSFSITAFLLGSTSYAEFTHNCIQIKTPSSIRHLLSRQNTGKHLKGLIINYIRFATRGNLLYRYPA